MKITVATAIVVIIFIISASVNLATWRTEASATHDAMTLRQDHLSEGFYSLQESIGDLENRIDSNDLSTARIETKLANIETLLIEIKQDMKDHDDI